MDELKRIGVGIDFRDRTEHVVSCAARLARSSGAALDLIHVVPSPRLYDRVRAGTSGPDLEAALASARDRMAIAAGRATAGLDVHTDVSIGAPAEDIAKRARLLSDELLIVGPSTRHRPGWFGVGRTVSRLLHSAELPVLIAKGDLAEKPARILATTDFSDASQPALVEAVKLARLWGAELILLHVLEPLFHLHGLTATIAGESEIYAVEPADLEPEWQAVVGQLPLDGIPHRLEVVKGEAVAEIVAAADNVDADLLVIGAHGRSAMARALVGSSTEAVLEEYSGPMLVVPAIAEASAE